MLPSHGRPGRVYVIGKHLSRDNFRFWEQSQAQNRRSKPKLSVDKY